MKNIFLGFILLSAVCLSCSKDETCNYNDSTITASASETTAVRNYLISINATDTVKHPSGFYYKITQAGTGSAVVNLCSKITIKYVGKLTNGTVFDQSPAGQTNTFTLGDLIPGWQKGIPLISSGGKITLYLPPSLGYGSAPVGSIPANSILIFDVELIGVQ